MLTAQSPSVVVHYVVVFSRLAGTAAVYMNGVFEDVRSITTVDGPPIHRH